VLGTIDNHILGRYDHCQKEGMPMARQATEMTATLREVVEAERHKKVAARAFEFWLARAFRSGSPEADWLRADREVRGKTATGSRRRTPGRLFLVPPRI
jgi:hypothetical protein